MPTETELLNKYHQAIAKGFIYEAEKIYHELQKLRKEKLFLHPKTK